MDCRPSHGLSEAAEITVALPISFLDLKNTMLPCDMIRDCTCVLQLQSKKGQEDTEAINLQVKSNTKTKKQKRKKKKKKTLAHRVVKMKKCYVHSKYFTISRGVFQ